MTPQKTRRLAAKSLVYTILFVGAAYMVLPGIWMLSTALKTELELGAWPPHLIPRQPTFEAFVKGWTALPFGKFFLNSLIYTIGAVAIGVLFMPAIGYTLAKYQFRARNALFVISVATMLVPMHAIVIPEFMLLRNLRLVNTYLGLILPQAVNGFGIFLMRQFFLGIPDEIIEAARVDGASETRIYFQIVLPMAKPAIITLIILIILYRWNDLIWPLVATTGPSKFTLTVGIGNFTGVQYGIIWNQLMAIASIIVAPLMVLFICFQRHLVQAIVMEAK